MTRRSSVLLVEDDEILGRSMVHRLELEGFNVTWVRTAAHAARALDGVQADIIVSDIRLPDGDGASVMRSHFSQLGMVPTIFMTAYGDIDQAVQLVRDGAWDYLTKPFDLDALMESLIQLRDGAAANVVALASTSPAPPHVEETLIKAASLDLPVTLLGETGTGKEVAARKLHEAGAHAAHPFVAINASLLHSDMTESILFGHEAGAFTGASARHIGFVEEAGAGTFFLDEVGELDPMMQAKLLRLLDQRTFRRLGGKDDLPFRARLVCATNRDLPAMVERGAFRQDLWFRINVLTVTLRPLRERRDAIAPLLEEKALQAAERFGRPRPTFTSGAIEQALAYAWPGNIRELVNRVNRAVAMGDDLEISGSDLFPDLQPHTAPRAATERNVQPLAEVRDAAEVAHIRSVLDRNEGRIQDTAEQLGVSRTTLWERMKRFGLTPKR